MKPRPTTLRVQPSFSAFAALAAIDALARVERRMRLSHSAFGLLRGVSRRDEGLGLPSRLRRARIRIVVPFAVRVIAVVFGVFGFAVSVVAAGALAFIRSLLDGLKS